MEMQYFKSAWGDIKNSPGWFGKLCLLALLGFIPIFGQIVTFAYLYGWAREIAWGTHEPMPAKIFSNDDGKFWRRGWFALVLTFVFMLIPYIVLWLGNYWQGFGYSYSYFNGQTINNPVLVGFGGLLSLVGSLATVVMAVLAWIGIMRVSIYDRLSSGFQFGKIWRMLRHDTKGVLKIFGMNLLLSIIFGIILSIIIGILVVIVVSVGIAGLVNAGYFVNVEAFRYMTNAQALQMLAQFVASAGVVGFFAILIGAFCCLLVSVFIEMLVTRAMGYWTMQFDVPQWGGQDDPLPFELYEERQARQQTYAARQEPQAPSQQPAKSAPDAAAPAVFAAPAAVVAPIASNPVPDSASAVGSGASDETACPVEAEAADEADSPAVSYEKPITVGASFIMSPEEIENLEAEAQAQAVETSAAANAHGPQDAPSAPAANGDDEPEND